MIAHGGDDGLFGFFSTHSNDNALTKSEAIGFDDGWDWAGFDILKGLIDVIEDLIGGGWDAVFLH